MRVLVFSAKSYEIPYFESFNKGHHDLQFTELALNVGSVEMAVEFDAVCCFVCDDLNRKVLEKLKRQGVKLIALRSAGYDHVDIKAAHELELTVVRVSSYSPNAIAEFTIGLLLALVRKIPRAHDRVLRHNFSLEGQLGFNLQGKTIGLIGTGNIGTVTAKILSGFDCKLIAYDPFPNQACLDLGLHYVSQEQLFQSADVISLHCPLNADSHHIIGEKNLSLMKKGVVIINTGRGALIDTAAIIQALESGKVAALGIDVYENERELFFQDRSDEMIVDTQFIHLQSFPNVLITAHQAYFTVEALENIVNTTLDNITSYEKGRCINEVKLT
ncbi:MAG: 2-hydroxyacid dehydrogenase [Gammaproteobacteria bacterium]|nr:2-hydroxyacid dehydrogenase [Gammaproteobacteria bacterium]